MTFLFTGYRLCRRPLRLESPRIRCLELHVALDGYLFAWMAMSLGSILEPLDSFGALLGGLWVACELHWVRQGAPMTYLALLCRREHQFEGPGGQKGACGGSRFAGLKSPVAASCGPYRRIVDQILHHPAWAVAGMGHPGLFGLLPCCLGLGFEKHG